MEKIAMCQKEYYTDLKAVGEFIESKVKHIISTLMHTVNWSRSTSRIPVTPKLSVQTVQNQTFFIITTLISHHTIWKVILKISFFANVSNSTFHNVNVMSNMTIEKGSETNSNENYRIIFQAGYDSVV